MIVYRLRYQDKKPWPFQTDDENEYFKKDGMTKNSGIIYLSYDAAERAQRGIHGNTEIIAFEMKETVPTT